MVPAFQKAIAKETWAASTTCAETAFLSWDLGISCPFFRGQEVTVNTAGHFAVQTPQPGGLASSSYGLHRWENVTGSEGETLIEKIFSMLSSSKTWCAAAWTRFSMPWVWL